MIKKTQSRNTTDLTLGSTSNRLMKCICIFFGVVALGSTGFVLIENWSLGDAFYMTMITISTVGYGETRELSQAGRLFTTLLIVVSIATMTLMTSSITSFLISNNLNGKFLKRRMLKMASNLKDHTIICGTGFIAQVILDHLCRAGHPVVIVGDNASETYEIRRRFPNIPIVEGNPRSDLVLADANILRAKTVIATLENEFDNLLISMTAKELRSKIQVIARSEDPSLSGRLSKAGIDKVICPFLVTGKIAAEMVLENEGSSNEQVVASSNF